MAVRQQGSVLLEIAASYRTIIRIILINIVNCHYKAIYLKKRASSASCRLHNLPASPGIPTAAYHRAVADEQWAAQRASETAAVVDVNEAARCGF